MHCVPISVGSLRRVNETQDQRTTHIVLQSELPRPKRASPPSLLRWHRCSAKSVASVVKVESHPTGGVGVALGVHVQGVVELSKLREQGKDNGKLYHTHSNLLNMGLVTNLDETWL